MGKLPQPHKPSQLTRSSQRKRLDDKSKHSKLKTMRRNSHRSVEDFNQAISIDQKFVFAYQGRGYAYSQLKKYKKAIEDFTKAIELDPNFTYAYLNRGINRVYSSNILGMTSADGQTILHFGNDDGKDMLQDFQQAAQLFHEQKDERGKKELVQIISNIQNILNNLVPDENVLKIQEKLTKIKDSINIPSLKP